MRILVKIAEVIIRSILILRFGGLARQGCRHPAVEFCGQCPPCKAKLTLRHWRA